jgi:uncharacterized membrane protein YphA (DoxX/SURF4 family)
MKYLRAFSRIILGALFIFSGFVKALDPLGSAYKFADYFQAFNLGFLDSISLILAIFLAAFELVLGLVLLLGYQKKITYWVLFFFMSFFTVLTFILALTNPVTDCGCFGDAIIMTNWQTFFKNLVFMIFVLLLFGSRSKVKNIFSNLIERSLILLFFVGSSILSISGLHHLPCIDFRPYDIGTTISEEMEVPEGAPQDEYSTILFYKNMETEKTEEFTIDNYPEDTAKYHFLTSESKLINKGYEPPIHDFGVMDSDGYDVSDQILSFAGYTLFMTSPDIEKADKNTLQQCNDWALMEKLADDFQFIPVTASAGAMLEELTLELGLEYEFYAGDEIMLKTMVRSNPGFFLLKNGTIIAKWSWRDFPTIEEWNKDWPEVLQQYTEEQDPEIMMLIEEGLMEELEWDLIDFDRSANRIVSIRHTNRADGNAWVIYITIIAFVVLGLQLIPARKKDRRA